MDRRQQKTKAAIYKAFEELVAKKGYQKITVQEIIEKANVGRTTFYAHFETKDALLQAMCDELFHHVFCVDKAEATHNFSLSRGDGHKILTHMFCHLKDNKAIITRLMTGESSEVFLFYFKQDLSRLFESSLLQGMSCKNKAVPADFLNQHIAGSFVNTVQWWIRGGMRESPEEIGKNFFAVIDPILQ